MKNTTSSDGLKKHFVMGIHYRKHDLYPESILIRDFVGKVFVDDIIESWNYLIKNQMITSSTKGIINDLTGCELKMEMTGFEKLIAFLKKHEFLKNIRLAVICDNPEMIIFPVLGENKVKDLKIKPFSGFEAGVDWILFSPK